jgi:hypothetical protein
VSPVPGKPGLYDVDVSVQPPAAGGDVLGVVELPTSVGAAPNLQLSVIAMSDRGVSASESTIDLGLLVNDGSRIHHALSVYSHQGPFEITSVETDDVAVGVQASRVEGTGSLYLLDVTYDGHSWRMGSRHEGSIQLKTNSPISPLLQIKYLGTVRSWRPDPPRSHVSNSGR